MPVTGVKRGPYAKTLRSNKTKKGRGVVLAKMLAMSRAASSGTSRQTPDDAAAPAAAADVERDATAAMNTESEEEKVAKPHAQRKDEGQEREEEEEAAKGATEQKLALPAPGLLAQVLEKKQQQEKEKQQKKQQQQQLGDGKAGEEAKTSVAGGEKKKRVFRPLSNPGGLLARVQQQQQRSSKQEQDGAADAAENGKTTTGRATKFSEKNAEPKTPRTPKKEKKASGGATSELSTPQEKRPRASVAETLGEKALGNPAPLNFAKAAVAAQSGSGSSPLSTSREVSSKKARGDLNTAPLNFNKAAAAAQGSFLVGREAAAPEEAAAQEKAKVRADDATTAANRDHTRAGAEFFDFAHVLMMADGHPEDLCSAIAVRLKTFARMVPRPEEELRAALFLMDPSAVVPAKAIAAAITEAFGLPCEASLTGEALAAKAMEGRWLQQPLPSPGAAADSMPLPTLALTDAVGAVSSVALAADAEAKELQESKGEAAVVQHLARLLVSTRSGMEPFYLVRAWQGKLGVAKEVMQRAMARALLV